MPIASISSNGPSFPAETPPHDPVHIVRGVRDGRRDHGRIHEGRCERVTQETAGVVRGSEQRANALANVGD